MAQRFLTLILLLCSISFAGLFDAPGRSNFIPADQAFVSTFSKTSTTSTSPGVRAITSISKLASRRLRKRGRIADARWRVA
jgi:thiol:disulfide interchange protein